ncbi:MAG: Holliday junction branch migration protein RuvA [Flavobacteriales bacterium]
MIYFIEGKIEELSPTFVLINTNGIGYGIEISVRSAEQLTLGDKVKLYTQQIIRDDAHILYGFHNITEKQCFNMLITVSGVGVNTARVILSSLSPQDVVAAILYDDVKTFQSVKGIGTKTAQRILVDLKDKAAKFNIIQDVDKELVGSSENIVHPHQYKQEALSALETLGFNLNLASKAIDKLLKTEAISSVEDLIKKALGRL